MLTQPFTALRRRRSLAGWCALLALLAAQLAIAAYACPLLERRSEAPPPCHEIDVESPALCKAFLQSDEQGLDSPRALPDIGAALLPNSVFEMPPAPIERGDLHRAALVPAAAGPPLIVLLGRRRD